MLLSTTVGETAIKSRRDDLCLCQLARIQAGGVDTFRDVVCLCCGRQVFVCSHLRPLIPRRMQKPLSSLRSAPCMICIPLPRRKCSDDDPAFLCHVPAALSSFALCSLVWTRLPRRNEISNRPHFIHSNTSIWSGPACQLGYTATVQVCTCWWTSGPRDSRACLGLRGLRRRLQVPSRIFCRPRTRTWLWHTQLMVFVGLSVYVQYSHVC